MAQVAKGILRETRKPKVALKYCGCCNPQVDLHALAIHLAYLAAKTALFELVQSTRQKADIVVILCGCYRACGDKEEVRSQAKRCVVVAGNQVAGRPCSESELPQLLTGELNKALSLITITA